MDYEHYARRGWYTCLSSDLKIIQTLNDEAARYNALADKAELDEGTAALNGTEPRTGCGEPMTQNRTMRPLR